MHEEETYEPSKPKSSNCHSEDSFSFVPKENSSLDEDKEETHKPSNPDSSDFYSNPK